MKNNAPIAALWRDAEDKDSRCEIFQFYLASDFIGHKSYAYGEAESTDLDHFFEWIFSNDKQIEASTDYNK